MKKLNLFSVFTLVIFLTLGLSSCSQDEDYMDALDIPVAKTQAEANLILVNYLELHGDEYVLNISQTEAEQCGVRPEFFSNTLLEIVNTNELIAEIRKEPEHELVLTDPQNDVDNTDSYVGLRGAPNGTLTANGQEVVTSPFIWAPIYTKGIRFSCRANAAITPVYTCRTNSSALWQTKTAIGILGSNTKVEVPLYVSNDNIRVSFQTTDSNGGKATYEGY